MANLSAVSALRSRLVNVDQQHLTLLLPHATLNREQTNRVAELEGAKAEIWPLLVAAESDEANI